MVGVGLIGTVVVTGGAGVVVTGGTGVVVTGGTDVVGVLGEVSTLCFRDRMAFMTIA